MTNTMTNEVPLTNKMALVTNEMTPMDNKECGGGGGVEGRGSRITREREEIACG